MWEYFEIWDGEIKYKFDIVKMTNNILFMAMVIEESKFKYQIFIGISRNVREVKKSRYLIFR